MLKKDEIANPNSCLNRAQDDEPIFVLKASDASAPTVIVEWCSHYHERHRKAKTLTKERLAKESEALKLARQMEAWRLEHPEKT